MAYFSTPPLVIIDHPADAKHFGGIRRAYRWIVLHATGGTDSAAWLSTASNPPVSVHRLIRKDGAIMKIVPDEQVAWHAGPATVGRLPSDGLTINNDSLGIELENLNDGRDPYPLKQIDACVSQVVEWYGLYGALPIVGHGWIQANKYDPLDFNWPAFYALLFARLGALL